MNKTCARCHLEKPEELFYFSCGKRRSECKSCTIRRNGRYQKRVKPWRNRDTTSEDRKAFMRKYYENNKEKFAKYRSNFRIRHPEYYKEYFRKRREK